MFSYKFTEVVYRKTNIILYLETFSELNFRRFFGSFEPIFDPKCEGLYTLSILPLNFRVEKRPK